MTESHRLRMSRTVQPGTYRHYKGGAYRVIGVARHTENSEDLVIYESLHDAPDFPAGSLWVRPLSMFLETVAVNGENIPRFARISD